MKKSVIIISIIFIIIGLAIIGVSFTKEKPKNSNISKQTNIMRKIKPEVSIPSKDNPSDKGQPNMENILYIVQPNGAIKKNKQKIDVIDQYSGIINISFSIYKTDKYNNIITMPENIRINSTKIYNGTLTVDFSKEIKNIKFKDVGYEEHFIKALVLSLKASSDKFQDVQFTVEGNKEAYIFGNISTSSPIRYDLSSN